jgi:hypothetical protein
MTIAGRVAVIYLLIFALSLLIVPLLVTQHLPGALTIETVWILFFHAPVGFLFPLHRGEMTFGGFLQLCITIVGNAYFWGTVVAALTHVVRRRKKIPGNAL